MSSYASDFCRLRLSSHSFPVETGRWRRIPRNERMCPHCNILGDEIHYIYTCPIISRDNINEIPELNHLENFSDLPLLLKEFKRNNFL